MAEEAKAQTGRKFQPVTVTPKIHGGAQSDVEAGTVTVTGRVPLNAAASKRLAKMALDENLEIEKFGCSFGVDQEGQLIAAYPVPPGTAGAMPVRWNKEKGTATLYLQGVFQMYPLLRSTGPRHCVVSADRDADGKACMVIALQTALTKRRKIRDVAGDTTTEPVSES